MDIIISNASGVPIYEQIVRQIKGAILSGQVSEGEALPSIRLLARDLRISVITTKRAYEELERSGFVTTVPGKGLLCGPSGSGDPKGGRAVPGGGAFDKGCRGSPRRCGIAGGDGRKCCRHYTTREHKECVWNTIQSNFPD